MTQSTEDYERRIAELESELADSRQRLSDLSVRGELVCRLVETLEKMGITLPSPPDTPDTPDTPNEPDTPGEPDAPVTPRTPTAPANPTNPASRDTDTARNLRKSEARAVLREMAGRGLLR